MLSLTFPGLTRLTRPLESSDFLLSPLVFRQIYGSRCAAGRSDFHHLSGQREREKNRASFCSVFESSIFHKIIGLERNLPRCIMMVAIDLVVRRRRLRCTIRIDILISRDSSSSSSGSPFRSRPSVYIYREGEREIRRRPDRKRSGTGSAIHALRS